MVPSEVMRAISPKPEGVLPKHWWRLKRSLGRRWREWRLPRGFERLGTKYGGWWIYAPAVRADPLLIDCGLGVDISFPAAFLARFGGHVVGIDPNPAALDYARARCPQGMEVRAAAFWSEAARELTFHLPRPLAELPKGADGVSGSLLATHEYAGAKVLTVRTTSLAEVLGSVGQEECDVLKLDVEGAEYEVLASLCASGDIRRARQLLIEFHHHCTDRTLRDTQDCMVRIEASGFRLQHTEDRNCVFLRRD
jgi:FkbM family methyltransferase